MVQTSSLASGGCGRSSNFTLQARPWFKPPRWAAVAAAARKRSEPLRGSGPSAGRPTSAGSAAQKDHGSMDTKNTRETCKSVFTGRVEGGEVSLQTYVPMSSSGPESTMEVPRLPAAVATAAAVAARSKHPWRKSRGGPRQPRPARTLHGESPAAASGSPKTNEQTKHQASAPRQTNKQSTKLGITRQPA